MLDMWYPTCALFVLINDVSVPRQRDCYTSGYYNGKLLSSISAYGTWMIQSLSMIN